MDLPVAFNDVRIRAFATDGVELRTHVVGGKTAGLLSWSATCLVRRDGTLGPGGAGASDETRLEGAPPIAEMRVLTFPDATCSLVVEAQGSDPLAPAAGRTRFLKSFQRTGPPTW